MTTPTPRVDALTRFEFGDTGEPFPAHALLSFMQLARELERDLAAAQDRAERTEVWTHGLEADMDKLREELAAAQDELVRELRDAVKFDEHGCSEINYNAIEQAAAALVALQAENFTLAAGQCIVDGGLLGDDHGHQYCAIKAERDRLKAHAEAMANAISGPEHTRAVDAYRRDFPKDAQ